MGGPGSGRRPGGGRSKGVAGKIWQLNKKLNLQTFKFKKEKYKTVMGK